MDETGCSENKNFPANDVIWSDTNNNNNDNCDNVLKASYMMPSYRYECISLHVFILHPIMLLVVYYEDELIKDTNPTFLSTVKFRRNQI